MKEFYLIPKTVYERQNMIQNRNVGGIEDVQAPMKSMKKKEITKRKEVRVPLTSTVSSTQPHVQPTEKSGKKRRELQVPLSSFVTSIPPPITKMIKTKKKKNKKVSVVLKTLDRHIEYNKPNPSLSHLIDLSFPVTSRNNALALLKVFERIPTMEWKENGDLIYPLNDYNIIDIIRTMVNTKTKVDTAYLDDYRYLVSVLNIPVELIRNNSIKQYISDKTVPPSNRKKGGYTKVSWLAY